MIDTDGYNNVDQFADGYMEQEEEWEREGLLDPAWEKQQKKVGVKVYVPLAPPFQRNVIGLLHSYLPCR